MKRFVAVILLFALVLTGCTPSQQNQSQHFAVEVLDDTSSTVILDEPAGRVVSLAPSATEIVFALGMEDHLVGVSNFCNYPDEARQIQKVGDFFNPNTELIISLDPDLVLAVKGVQETLVNTLKKNSIPVYVYDPHDVAGIIDNILDTGRLLGAEKAAENLAHDLESTIVQQEPTGLKVFIEINPEPIMTAGSGTFISDLIRKAGFENAGDEFGEGYPVVSPEALLEIQPDIYLISRETGVTPDDIAARPGFNTLACVRKGNVFVISNDDIFFRPGPRIVQAYEELIKLAERVQR